MKVTASRLFEIVSLGLLIGMFAIFMWWYILALDRVIEMKKRQYVNEQEYLVDIDPIQAPFLRGNSGPDIHEYGLPPIELGI